MFLFYRSQSQNVVLDHPDITGSTWLLIKELHRKTNTQVKSGGEISKPYVNHQGVKLGGI
jgi:hypothetical protein